MEMRGKSKLGPELVSHGVGNGQIIGDGNVQNIMMMFDDGRKELPHSIVHDLLVMVYDGLASPRTNFSLSIPVAINTKLRFNNAKKYIRYFQNHADDFLMVESAIREFPDSEKIVKKLGDLFVEVSEVDEEGTFVVGDGDVQLGGIQERLVETILGDARYDPMAYPMEDIESFCIALLAYGVSRCVVLVRP